MIKKDKDFQKIPTKKKRKITLNFQITTALRGKSQQNPVWVAHWISTLHRHFLVSVFPWDGYSYCSNNLYSPPISNFWNKVLQLRAYQDTYQIDKDRYIPLHINCRVLYLMQNFFNSMHSVYQSHLPLQFNVISLGLRKLLILSL